MVRENNQTYRLGWTEQCKDGSRMGVGMPEYLLLFRRPPTDRSNGYADVPVVKQKKVWEKDHWTPGDGRGYSRARWQLDAHGFARSNGDRLLQPEDLVGLPADVVYRMYRKHSLEAVYDFEHHVACGEAREARGELPPSFMLLPPQSRHPDVWTDVARMRTLNMMQERNGWEFHLCPMQFDIADRIILQMTMEGETVFDPFAGLMTVPYCAVKLKRMGVGIELGGTYFDDGAWYVERAARQRDVPTLFGAIGSSDGAEQGPEVSGVLLPSGRDSDG